MYKGMVAVASALALIALGSLAQAGSTQGTPRKYQNTVQTHHSQITEFSSSSAATHSPKR
jgi:hypothetical protein